MVRRILIGIAILIPMLIGVLVVAARPKLPTLPVLWPVPAFTLISQDSAPFEDRALEGQVWIASFVYTNCPDVCPLVTRRVAELRDSLQAVGAPVRFLSISVDPARDTPAVLREYAKAFNATLPQWVFLTGEPETVIQLVTAGFKLQASNPFVPTDNEMDHDHGGEAEHRHEPSGDYMVSHSDRLVLIDAQRQVRGTYSSSDPEAMQQLRRDLGSIGL